MRNKALPWECLTTWKISKQVRPVTILFQDLAVASFKFTLQINMAVLLMVALLSCWTQDWLVQYVYCSMADIYCCVIFAASAFISEMSSRLIRNTKRRPAICRNRYRMSMFVMSTTQIYQDASVWLIENLVDSPYIPPPLSCCWVSTCCLTGPVCHQCRLVACPHWQWRSLHYSSVL